MYLNVIGISVESTYLADIDTTGLPWVSSPTRYISNGRVSPVNPNKPLITSSLAEADLAVVIKNTLSGVGAI